MSKELQLQLEKQYSNKLTRDYLKSEFVEAEQWHIIEGMATKLLTFVTDSYDSLPENRPDLIEVFEFFMNEDTDISKMLWKMLCHVMTKGSVTVASLAGMVYYDIRLENKHRKFLAIEFLLNIIDESPLAYSTITYGKECLFKTYSSLPQEMQEAVEAQGYPLPMLTKPVAKTNASRGYMSFSIPVIAGGSLKQHEEDIVLSSLNRANAVPYSCELRIMELTEYTFNPEKKYKDDGFLETDMDVAKRHESFLRLQTSMPIKMKLMVDAGNVFHIPHGADNRIRRYANAYEMNYQGCKYIKAMVQFANKEKVVPEW